MAALSGSSTLTPNKITRGEFGQKEPMPAIVDTGETGNWIVILRHPSALEMLLPPPGPGIYCKGRSQLMNGRGQIGSGFASQIWNGRYLESYRNKSI